MKRLTLAVGCLALAAACGSGDAAPRVYDVQLSGGLVFDGVSTQGVHQDVFIIGDEIAFVGNGAAEGRSAKTVIDVTDLIVAPGFIDPHTHALDRLPFDRAPQPLNNYLTQGVTSLVVGNDGDGPADVAAARQLIETVGIGPNVALFTGHGAIRRDVMGLEDRAPTSAELDQMQALVKQAMEDGALGLSTGLYYVPGGFAETSEIIALAQIVGGYSGVYDSHIRDESSYTIGLLAAVDEAIDIGRQSGAAVNIAHIKALGADVWGQSEEVIARIEAARADGIVVTADQYPWPASGTHMSSALVPNWARSDSEDAMLKRLRDPALAGQLRTEMAENLRRRGGPDAILIVVGAEADNGLNLAQAAERQNLDPIEAAIKIVLEGDARIASFNMTDDDIAAFMRQPWVMTSSDGTDGHPRKYASFPRKYRTYVMERKTISLTEFINRSTALTAQTLDLCGRGELKSGAFADIVVFDPDQFGPVADFKNPAELSTGVVHLFVNGRHVINDGALGGDLVGHTLRRGACDTSTER